MSCQHSSELLPACNCSCRIGGRFLFSASNSLKSYLPCFRQHSVINFFSMFFYSCRIKYGLSFYLSLMGPMMATLICNAVIFCSVVRKLSQRKTGTTNRSQTKDRNRRLKVSISLAVILGLNWFVGLLLLENTNTALQWIFTILVSSQGFAIFIAQVLVHRQVKSFASSKISSSSSATGTSRLRSSSATSTLLSNFLLNFRRSSSVQSDPADILAMKHSRMDINLSHTYGGSSPSLAGSWASGDVLMFSSDFKTTRGGDAYSQIARSSRWGSANPSLASASEFESDLSEAVGEFPDSSDGLWTKLGLSPFSGRNHEINSRHSMRRKNYRYRRTPASTHHCKHLVLSQVLADIMLILTTQGMNFRLCRCYRLLSRPGAGILDQTIWRVADHFRCQSQTQPIAGGAQTLRLLRESNRSCHTPHGPG